MNVQHLSDEAVAAFADGVLGGHARDRASKHVDSCPECRVAVLVQREAVYALRAAPAPALPTDLMARLRTVPQTTPITTLPTAIAADGSTVLAARGLTGRGLTGRGMSAPMAALVPVPVQNSTGSTHRAKPIVTAVALAALAGALTAGSVASQAQTPAQTGAGTRFVNNVPSNGAPAGSGQHDIIPVSVLRALHP